MSHMENSIITAVKTAIRPGCGHLTWGGSPVDGTTTADQAAGRSSPTVPAAVTVALESLSFKSAARNEFDPSAPPDAWRNWGNEAPFISGIVETSKSSYHK